MAEFVHLHLHTEWSLLNGIIRIDELFSKAKEFGYKAVAITDHASLSGLIYFYEKAISSGIKPILGCEIFVSSDHAQTESSPYHLVLLCENNTGYKNLLKLCTKAYLENVGKKPTVTKQLLCKFNKGLIALSGCLCGEIPSAILQGEMDKAKNIAMEYAQIFPGRFYLEVQENGIAEQKIINKGLLKLAKELKLPLVATNNCHYLLPEDVHAQKIKICMNTDKILSEETAFYFNTDKLYFASPDEMVARFSWCKEAVENTLHIAERCNVKLKLDKPLFLNFSLFQKQSYEELFEKKLWENFEKRLSELKNFFGLSAPEKEYRRRLEYETEIIKRKGLCEYFLISSELVNWTKSEGILKISPGYGTTASSLVAFILGITDIDPIRYSLFFERFLNPDTEELPEIGIELPLGIRKKAISHLKEKCGAKEHVAEIITFSRLKVHTIVSKLQKIMEISSSKIEKILKFLSLKKAISLKEIMQNEPEIDKLIKVDEEILRLFKIVIALENLPYDFSTLSVGLLVSSAPLSNFCPLMKQDKDKVATQFDLWSLNKLGLTRLNLLENSALTLINLTLELVERNTKRSIKLNKIPFNDTKTYELLKKGDTEGIFQLESSGIKELLRALKPDSFNDLIALLALYRPSTIEEGIAEQFINAKHKKVKDISLEGPESFFNSVLKETYGVLLYHEQVMEIIQKVAGYSLSKANILRKLLSKRDTNGIKIYKEDFISRARLKGISETKAEKVFNFLERFTPYAFSKSHATSYALISYYTAYLKAHYPSSFMEAYHLLKRQMV